VEKRREYATIIHDSGQHLLEVVNSILDISKMEAGRFLITTEPFELPPLIDSCCDIVSLRASQGNIELKRDFPERLDELIADKRALKQVLINLLGNAIKFTPAGGRVTVGARQDGAHVSIFVSDTGCGMSPYDLPRLGGAFFQAGAADDRTYEGTGLGLSVVRGLVGLHGGEISIESGLGLGTTVSVRIPMDCSGGAGGRPSARIIVIPRGPVAPGLPEIALNPSDDVRKSA
jgi:cell cycle sensor histidine kinase DivJ